MSDSQFAKIVALVVVFTSIAIYLFTQMEFPEPERAVEEVETPPVVEEAKPEPKQSPYVMYIYVCDQIEAVVVMSDPPMSVDRYHSAEPSPEMLEFMAVAEITNRVLTFNSSLYCTKPEVF